MPQAPRIPIDTALVSRLRWDGVPPSLRRCPRCWPEPLQAHGRARPPCPGPKLAVVQRRCLPPRKPPAHCQTFRNRWRTLFTCPAAPLSCPRSWTSTALLMRIRGLSAAAAEYRPVCAAIRTLCSVRSKKVFEARHQPSTLHVQGLVRWVFSSKACDRVVSKLCLSHQRSMLLSQYEFAAGQCVGSLQHQPPKPMCHGLLCLVQ